MSTTWTLTRFVRWRIKDWASCFLACRIPLDDDPDTCPKLPIRNMVYEVKDGDGTCSRGNINKAKKKLLKRHKCSKERQLNISPPTSSDYHHDSSWSPHFADEDFIVFCFREDGAFDVVKDGRKEASDSTRTSIRLVNRKLKCAEDAEATNKNSHEGRTVEDEHDICSKNEGKITIMKQGDEEECIYLDTESPCGCMRRKHQQAEEIENRALMSVESRDSNQSDTSTGSFAFPILRWEWTGSPVQMPKSEDLHLTKHRARSMSFQCFSF